MEQNKLLKEAKKNFIDLEFKGKECSLQNEEDIKWAIEKAYRDMSVRTIKKHYTKVKQDSCEWLWGKIKEYFKKDSPREQKEYDDLHKNLCKQFLDVFNEKLENKQEFGKAQKIVNMTFKYLYCFKDSGEKEDWFKFCHMPIDSYALNWYRKLPGSKGTIPSNMAWSNLDEEKYDEIQNRIIQYLKDGNVYNSCILPKIPLQADFIIWQEEKRRVMLKELKANLKKCGNSKYFVSKLSDSDKEEIAKYANFKK